MNNNNSMLFNVHANHAAEKKTKKYWGRSEK